MAEIEISQILGVVGGCIGVGSIVINFLNYRDRMTSDDKKRLTEELEKFAKQNDKEISHLRKELDSLIEEIDDLSKYSNKTDVLEEKFSMIHTRLAEIQAEQTRRYEGINSIMKDLVIAFKNSNSNPNIK